LRVIVLDPKLLTPENLALRSDAVSTQGAKREGAAHYSRTCWFLKRIANLAIGVAAGGIPWTLYNFNGYGPTVMFSGFVLYLILMELHSRLVCD
jgi:hypothetical protein